jgi:hypothetical protein
MDHMLWTIAAILIVLWLLGLMILELSIQIILRTPPQPYKPYQTRAEEPNGGGGWGQGMEQCNLVQ